MAMDCDIDNDSGITGYSADWITVEFERSAPCYTACRLGIPNLVNPRTK